MVDGDGGSRFFDLGWLVLAGCLVNLWGFGRVRQLGWLRQIRGLCSGKCLNSADIEYVFTVYYLLFNLMFYF